MFSLAIVLSIAIKNSLPSISFTRSILVSQDITAVVYREFEEKNIKNIESPNTAVALLSGVVIGESGRRGDIEDCSVTGDRGRSIGLGQVMKGPNWLGHSRKEICGSRQLQLKLALRVLDFCSRGAHEQASVFRCYTSGNSKKDSYIARHENSIYESVNYLMLANSKHVNPTEHFSYYKSIAKYRM